MVFLVAVAQAAQDLRRFLDRGFVDLDHLEAARQGPVAVERTLVLGVGGGADAAQLAGGQAGFQDVRGVEGAGRRRAGADDRVNLVDEQDVLGLGHDAVDHRLQPLLEVSAVAGAGEQRTHVERVDRDLGEEFRHVPFVDGEGQPLDDRGLADAGVSDQDRVVLAPARQRLAHDAHFVQTSDEGVDGALRRALVQVRGKAFEGILDFFLLVPFHVRLRGLRRGQARRRFDRAVGEVADDVKARDVLDLEDVDRVGLLLAQQRGDHGAGVDLALARAVSVHRGPLDHAPERHRLLGGCSSSSSSPEASVPAWS